MDIIYFRSEKIKINKILEINFSEKNKNLKE